MENTRISRILIGLLFLPAMGFAAGQPPRLRLAEVEDISPRGYQVTLTLDPDLVHEMLVGIEPMDDILRASGQYGPRVDVPADADEQTRLIAFTGRTP